MNKMEKIRAKGENPAWAFDRGMDIDPIQVALIGFNETAIIWAVRNESEFGYHPYEAEGFKWVSRTYEAWTDVLIWMTPRMVQRHITSLESKGLLISRRFNVKDHDQTKSYRVDTKALFEMVYGAVTREKGRIDGCRI